MFTEEFQVEYYRTINGCLDERRFVVGEWPWNFADFSTQQGPMRVGSCNRKGCSPVSAPQAGRPLLP